MIPSVGPSNSALRRHSSRTRNKPLSVSSTTGAPSVADTYSPVPDPSAGWVTYSSPAVLMSSANSEATPAPQANARTRAPRGSGSRRSMNSTAAISSGTGSSASGNATKAGATPSPAATLCAASMVSARIAHAVVMTMLTMKEMLVRPGGRPSITALGSNTGVVSVMAEAYCARALPDGARPCARAALTGHSDGRLVYTLDHNGLDL